MLNFPAVPLRRPSLAALAASVAAAFALSLPPSARADNLQDAQRLLKQGQHAQAIDQVDKHLAGKPKDAQGRFLKGLILTEMGKTGEAITVFTKLTEDYPELPEPYNNLAVIYAQQKQYDKAKNALEMAIRTHPSYATAHENLGDIYARLASQAYDKALQLDKGNASAQSKLSMIRDIMSTSARSGSKPATKTTTKPADVKPIETKPITVAAATPTPAPTVQPAPALQPVAAPQPTPTPPQTKTATAVPVAVAPAATPAKPTDSKPAASAGNVSGDVSRALESWAAAWSKKDVKAYLAHYASDFQTPDGESRSAWESERNKRIAKPAPIQVSIESLRITAEGTDRATAKFRQHYRSGKLKTSANKTIVMVKRDGKWQIQQETIGK